MYAHTYYSYLLRSSNRSGNKKLSKDHNSVKLFCKGVPVNNSLLAASYVFNVLMSGNKKQHQNLQVQMYTIWYLIHSRAHSQVNTRTRE